MQKYILCISIISLFFLSGVERGFGRGINLWCLQSKRCNFKAFCPVFLMQLSPFFFLIFPLNLYFQRQGALTCLGKYTAENQRQGANTCLDGRGNDRAGRCTVSRGEKISTPHLVLSSNKNSLSLGLCTNNTTHYYCQ